MAKLDDYLDPFEQVIWRGKPYKKAFILHACGALPFALFFFLLSLTIFYRAGIIGPQLIILVFVVMLALQPLGAFRLYPNTEYMVTNQRLLISDVHGKVWFSRLDKIKKVVVKKGITDKILGTGTIYPITEEYPYVPGGWQRYNSDNPINAVTKVYNHVREEYEEVTKLEFKMHTRHRPKLELMKEPYKIQKILEEAIFGAGTNYVNCEYCSFRYDLNKEGKCPNCGGTHQKMIDS